MLLHLVFEVGPTSASNTLSGFACEPGGLSTLRDASPHFTDLTGQLPFAGLDGLDGLLLRIHALLRHSFSMLLFLLRRHRCMASLDRIVEELTFRILQTVLDAGLDLREMHVDTFRDVARYERALAMRLPS